MNNREAIALLRNLEDSLGSYCELNEEGKTAFRMAIEALRCSEIPNNSETISRQQAIEALYNVDEYNSRSVTVIKNLPSVQPERKTGRWIAITSWNNTYKCSVCGRLLVNITDGKNKVAKNYPYCHCGADMRGGQE